jgi:tellurite methyltransferase
MSTPSGPDWPAYHRAVAGASPRPSLLAALSGFEQPGLAVDLGCGGGTDTVELLRRGWRVLAIDAEPHAIEFLRQRTDVTNAEHLETYVSRLEDATWPPADLINASLVLPFLGPAAFDDVWARIVASLQVGGRFAGHFFGERDAWATLANRTHDTRDQVELLLSAFDIELLNEREYDGQTALGTPKHWHLFEVAARKRL